MKTYEEDDTDVIQHALEQEIENVTADIPTLDLKALSGEIADAESEQSDDHISPPPKEETVSTWFLTFMSMNIPIFGWFYLFRLAFSKKHTQRQNFARAYLFYKLIFLAVSALILGILIYVGLDMLDQLLAYMEML